MNYTTLITAAALATLPMMASAAFVPIDDDGSSTISTTNDDVFTFNLINYEGNFEHEFTLTGDGEGEAQVSLTGQLAAAFTGLVAEWLDTNGDVLSFGEINASGDAIAFTTFSDATSLIQTLRIRWEPVKNAPNFDGTVTVSTVPVPAGLLLMGTALAGLGLARRKA